MDNLIVDFVLARTHGKTRVLQVLFLSLLVGLTLGLAAAAVSWVLIPVAGFLYVHFGAPGIVFLVVFGVVSFALIICELD